jgi:2-dehydropantoate 2-reductase
MSAPHVAILGAGGIGGAIGAYLTRAGHDVTLIDQWAEHVAVMQRDGLTVTDVRERFTVAVQAVPLSDANRLRQPFDIALLCVKSYDTVWSAHLIRPHLAPTGFVLPVMNALNDEAVAQVVGYPRTVGCVTAISAGLYEPGQVVRTDPMTTHAFTVGELSGVITPRVRRVVEIVSALGPSAATANIWGARWAKMVWNCMGNALAGLLGPQAALSPAERELEALIRAQAAAEAVRVAMAQGIALEPFEGLHLETFAGAVTRALLRAVAAQIALASGRRVLTAEQRAHLGVPGRPSLLQDVIKGRRTEVGYLNGHIVALGRELGVPAPMNAAITTRVHWVEEGTAQPGAHHLTALAEHLPA